jgi:hypothetical protein
MLRWQGGDLVERAMPDAPRELMRRYRGRAVCLAAQSQGGRNEGRAVAQQRAAVGSAGPSRAGWRVRGDRVKGAAS